jgi:hypothetical protein
MAKRSKWFEYRCVECEFTMLLPDTDEESPDICPGCYRIGSLWFQGAREVGGPVAHDARVDAGSDS